MFGLTVETVTIWCFLALFHTNRTYPGAEAYIVWSLPILVISPEWYFWPRCRIMMLPEITASPPNFFTPKRCPGLSRPFLVEPPAFFVAVLICCWYNNAVWHRALEFVPVEVVTVAKRNKLIPLKLDVNANDIWLSTHSNETERWTIDSRTKENVSGNCNFPFDAGRFKQQERARETRSCLLVTFYASLRFA